MPHALALTLGAIFGAFVVLLLYERSRRTSRERRLFLTARVRWLAIPIGAAIGTLFDRLPSV